MASPSTRMLRSGGGAEGSSLSGGGALEKSSRNGAARGGSCRNCGKKSLPNQPPPPRCCGTACGGRGGAPKPPKLKNCADAGPVMPTISASATVSATSGPRSVKMRQNDLVGSRMVLGSREVGDHNSRF